MISRARQLNRHEATVNSKKIATNNKTQDTENDTLVTIKTKDTAIRTTAT